jgi:hypothetical protein
MKFGMPPHDLFELVCNIYRGKYYPIVESFSVDALISLDPFYIEISQWAKDDPNLCDSCKEFFPNYRKEERRRLLYEEYLRLKPKVPFVP